MNKEVKITIGVLLLIIVSIGLLLVVNKKEKKVEDITTTWGKEYYKFLKDDVVIENQGTKIKEYNLNFYEIEGINDPVMVIDYQFNGKTYSNIYYITENEIRYSNSQDPTTVELLYNKENKKYEYYTNMTPASGGNFYENVKTQLINSPKDAEDPNRESSQGYYFMDSNPSLPKFDSVFEKVEVNEEVVKLKPDYSEVELQKAIVKKIKSYKTVEEIVKEKKD